MRLPDRQWFRELLDAERHAPQPAHQPAIELALCTVPQAEMSPPVPGMAIVAEGGGQRGIFTAGVLDVFLEQRFNPFELGVGVSAGAQNLLTYFLGEQGYARRAIAELTMAPDFFIPYRWLLNRSIIDLDHYFSRTLDDPDYQLPYRRLSDVGQDRALQFVATRRDTLEPVYLKPDADNAMDCLKASSAIPLLYKPGVPFDGTILIDGGVGDPLPVRHAADLGATHIVVIRTLPENASGSSWRERIESLRMRQLLPGSVLAMLQQHEQRNQEAVEFLLSPPDGVLLHILAPQQELASFAFGSDAQSVQQDYVTGRIAGTEACAYLKRQLVETGNTRAVYRPNTPGGA